MQNLQVCHGPPLYLMHSLSHYLSLSQCLMNHLFWYTQYTFSYIKSHDGALIPCIKVLMNLQDTLRTNTHIHWLSIGMPNTFFWGTKQPHVAVDGTEGEMESAERIINRWLRTSMLQRRMALFWGIAGNHLWGFNLREVWRVFHGSSRKIFCTALWECMHVITTEKTYFINQR